MRSHRATSLTASFSASASRAHATQLPSPPVRDRRYSRPPHLSFMLAKAARALLILP